MAEKTAKEARIRKEENRLKRIYKGLESKKKDVVTGLIHQAAYMRVCLDDLQADIDENGLTEMFQQGKTQEPYARTRPAADLYIRMNSNYQKITKQLTDLLPKEQPKAADQDDGFEVFIGGRDG